MKLLDIHLRNFRNYSDISLEFRNKFNLFYGNNGQGKTNLLEAVYYASLFRSFRTADSEKLVNFGKDFFALDANYEHDGIFHELSVFYHNKKKKLSLDNKNLKSRKEHQANFMVLFFSNEDIQTASGSPSRRRDYFDTILSLINPKYAHILKRYNFVLKQRNLDLKNNGSRTDKWDEALLSYGCRIVRARLSFLSVLRSQFSVIFRRLFKADLEPDIHYLSDKTVLKTPEDLDPAEYTLRAENALSSDRGAKTTVFGPHKDDYLFMIDERSVRDFASQGQMRLFVYALKFTIYEYMISAMKARPILLLDDIFADLDKYRIEYFFSYLKDCSQVFLSSANYYILRDFIEEYDLFNIHNGKITQGTFIL